MLFPFGRGHFHFLFLILFAVLMLVPIAKILRKAGWNPWVALLLIIPVINIVVLRAFAFGEWPALGEGPHPSEKA